MTSCSWIMPACTREKESKKQSQRGVQRCSTFQPIVQTSTPSNSSLPNSNPSCARSPPILSKASHSRSTACARPSSLASTRSHVQNAPHISPIRGMGNLNGKCSNLSSEPCAHPWLAALEGQQRSQQRLAVDLVRLGPPAAARCRDRGGIDHMALDPFIPQNPVHPEPVKAGFMNGDDRIIRARAFLCLAFEVGKPRQQSADVAGRQAILRHLLPVARRQRRQNPLRTTQFQRNENCAKLCADSGRSNGRMIVQHRLSPG